MRTIVFVIFLSLLFCACDVKNNNDDENKNEVSVKPDSLVGIPAINQKILKNPNNAQLYYNRAKLHFENGAKTEAKQDLDRAFSLDSSRADFFVLAADLCFTEKNSIEARKLLKQAILKDAQHIEARLKMAEIMLLLEQYKQSISFTNSALKIDKYNAKAYYMKGMNYKYLGDTAQAVSSIQTAVEQDPELYDAHIQLGMMYAAVHNPIATDYYNNAIRLRPNSVQAIYNKCIFLQEHGNPEKALEGYNLILELDPQNHEAHFNKGFVNLVYLKDNKEGLSQFLKAIELNANYFNAYYNAGLCCENLKDLKNAEKYFREALKIKPDFTLAAKGLGRIID